MKGSPDDAVSARVPCAPNSPGMTERRKPRCLIGH